MFQLGNINTTAEGFGFLGLLYGGHAGFSNLARFKLPEYDRLYEQARAMPNGPEREKVMQKMNELVSVYAPWHVTVFRYENVLVQPWIGGYKYNGINQHPWQYLDVDRAKRVARRGRGRDARGPRRARRGPRGLGRVRRGRARRAQAPARARSRRRSLRVMFPIAETGFDPQATSDLYSNHVNRSIYETLYNYDYLARPYKLIPTTAAAMPEISADGRVWTIRLKPGIRFADDPAFKGQPRELTAHDYVYAWKRLLDPRMRSPYRWYLDGKVVGADDVLAKAKEAGQLDYDAVIPGLRAVDRYTIRLELKEPDYIMQAYMAHAAMSAVAREVVEAYGDASGWVMANPVGTGPYRLKDWRRGQKIVLEANPLYRDETFPVAPANADAATKAVAAAQKGKKLPQIGRIEISIIEESSPQLLAFKSGDLDYMNVPADLVTQVLEPGAKLKPPFVEQKVALHRQIRPSLVVHVLQHGRPGRSAAWRPSASRSAAR